MSKPNELFPIVEEISSGKSGKKENFNENNITIELSKKKSEEDDKSTNSAECSAKELKSKEKNQLDLFNQIIPFKLSKKAYEKYTERLKEKTMREELDKQYEETEQLKNKYEEKNSFLHKFDNNPQFQKMLKMVDTQLKYFFIEGIFFNLFSALLYFYITRRKEGLALSSFCLSITELSICLILFFGLKLGILSDPNLSKAFRVFVIMESLLFFTSFIINVIAGILDSSYFKENAEFIIRIVVYLVFLLMIFIFFYVFKFCLNLFVESAMILLNRKTEYSILMLNEQNNKNDMNFNINLSTISNNVTGEVLNKDSNIIFFVDNNINKVEDKEEQQYKTLNYYKRFHYSVTSARNKDFPSVQK